MLYRITDTVRYGIGIVRGVYDAGQQELMRKRIISLPHRLIIIFIRTDTHSDVASSSSRACKPALTRTG